LAVGFGGELKLLVEIEDIWIFSGHNYMPNNEKPLGISRLAIVNKAFSLLT